MNTFEPSLLAEFTSASRNLAEGTEDNLRRAKLRHWYVALCLVCRNIGAHKRTQFRWAMAAAWRERRYKLYFLAQSFEVGRRRFEGKCRAPSRVSYRNLGILDPGSHDSPALVSSR